MTEKQLLETVGPLGEAVDIPYHDLGPRGRSPRVALVAGLHGNELNGVFVLSRLAAFLRSLQNDAADQGPELVDRVLVVPVINVLGFNARSRNWPFGDLDLNRQFPGDAAGEIGSRIADAVLGLTRSAYYRVDIHSSNLDIEEMPQVRLYDPNDDERATSCLFGTPAVVERPVSSLFTTTLAHAWQAAGGENFVLQAGQAGGLQTQHCETLFRALVAFLERIGVTRGVELAEEEEDLHFFGLRQSFSLISEHAGFFASRLEVGRWVQPGDVIGRVYDGFSGSVQAEVRSPVAGLVTALRRQPLMCEGDLVARVNTLKELDEDEDTYLVGQGQ